MPNRNLDAEELKRANELLADIRERLINLSGGAEPAREIGPISLVKGSRGKALQNLRYTNRQTIEQAKTLDDIW